MHRRPQPLARDAMAYVLAGGRGSRLKELTDRRAKPAVYFGGKTRIIDFALSKTIQFTERLRAQIRGEAFNLTNYYFFGRDSHFNTNPNDPNFGTIFPHQAWIGNGYPRQVQIGFKAFW